METAHRAKELVEKLIFLVGTDSKLLELDYRFNNIHIFIKKNSLGKENKQVSEKITGRSADYTGSAKKETSKVMSLTAGYFIPADYLTEGCSVNTGDFLGLSVSLGIINKIESPCRGTIINIYYKDVKRIGFDATILKTEELKKYKELKKFSSLSALAYPVEYEVLLEILKE